MTAELAASTFALGYHDIHPDVSLNYQMNRFSTGSPHMIAEMRSVAPNIHDYTDYVREFLNLSDKALAGGGTLEGANYLRSAEFFMFPGDPRKPLARTRYAQLMKQRFEVRDENHHWIRYGSSKLSAYRFTPPAPHGTVVVFGGFDSYIEELFSIQLYFRDAGFDVIGFEGPGQGAVLEDEHLLMTPESDRPVGVILDHFKWMTSR